MSPALHFLLADSARLLALMAGFAFLLLVGVVALFPLGSEVRVLVALALTGWVLILFGPRLQAWLDQRLRGVAQLGAPQRVVEELLQTSDLAALDQLWSQTLDRLFAPAHRHPQPIHGVACSAQGKQLRVPGVLGPGWVLQLPRRALARYDERDAELARQVWQLFESVRAAFEAFEQGKRRERERLAEYLMMEIEVPLLGIGARTDARPLADRFECCAAELWSVRLGLLSDPCALDVLLSEIHTEVSSRLAEAGIACGFESHGSIPSRAVDSRRSAYLRSLLREATTNVIRHSGARNAALKIHAGGEPHGLMLTLEDDGQGFDAGAAFQGQGLMNMRRRAVAIGARLTWSRVSSGGTRVVLEWSPTDSEAGENV